MMVTQAYEEIIDFIAAGTTPDSVVSFRPSEKAKERVAELIYREKTTGLDSDRILDFNQMVRVL
jgi:hypothetical protein